MDAEKQKTVSEEEHMRRAEAFQAAETEVQRLEKRLKSHIAKTRPYFEQKDVFNKALESQKLRVHDLQQKVHTGEPVDSCQYIHIVLHWIWDHGVSPWLVRNFCSFVNAQAD